MRGGCGRRCAGRNPAVSHAAAPGRDRRGEIGAAVAINFALLAVLLVIAADLLLGLDCAGAEAGESASAALGALAMTDSDKKTDWEALAAKESRGKDLSRETLEGITLKTVYGPEDAARDRQRLSRPRALHARALCDDVCRAAVDDPPICRLLDRRGIATPSTAATSPPGRRA